MLEYFVPIAGKMQLNATVHGWEVQLHMPHFIKVLGYLSINEKQRLYPSTMLTQAVVR